MRKIAQACEDYGQRVQYSVFELSLRDTDLEILKSRLIDIIKESEDSLRIYHLHGNREAFLEVHGRDSYEDFDGPLIV